MKRVVSVKVDEEVRDRLREQARARGMTLNQMMEKLIENLLYVGGDNIFSYVEDLKDFERVLRDS